MAQRWSRHDYFSYFSWKKKQIPKGTVIGTDDPDRDNVLNRPSKVTTALAVGGRRGETLLTVPFPLEMQIPSCRSRSNITKLSPTLHRWAIWYFLRQNLSTLRRP